MSAVEVIESELCLFVCVCLSVRTLTSGPFDLWPWFMVWELTLTLAGLGYRSSRRSKVNVTRSENVISKLLPEGYSHVKSLWPIVWLHVMSHYGILTSGEVTVWRHVTSHNEFVCVSQSITKKGLWAKGLYNGVGAGGMWTLGRFRYFLFLFIFFFFLWVQIEKYTNWLLITVNTDY